MADIKISKGMSYNHHSFFTRDLIILTLGVIAGVIALTPKPTSLEDIFDFLKDILHGTSEAIMFALAQSFIHHTSEHDHKNHIHNDHSEFNHKHHQNASPNTNTKQRSPTLSTTLLQSPQERNKGLIGIIAKLEDASMMKNVFLDTMAD
jgi:hypothetical protein